MSIEVRVFNRSGRKYLPRKKLLEIANKTLVGEGIKKAQISIIILDDNEIRELNNRFLKHDYPTDVLSFDLGNEEQEGELYIGIDTASLNAKEYKVSLRNELMRVVCHGILHLAGYDDQSNDERREMTERENYYLALCAK